MSDDASRIILAGIVGLKTTPDNKYHSWLHHFRKSPYAIYSNPRQVWASLPEAIRALLICFEPGVPTSQESDMPQFEYSSLLHKWEEIEANRTLLAPKSSSNFDASFPINRQQDIVGILSKDDSKELSAKGTQNNLALTATDGTEIDVSRSTISSTYITAHSVLTFLGEHPKSSIILGGSFIGWLFSPFDWLPIILLCGLLGKLLLNLYRRKTSIVIFRSIIFMLSVILIGIFHDVYFDPHPTAQCRDGSYSYSAHHSGTCSWHDGVGAWNPTLHHWWQSIF